MKLEKLKSNTYRLTGNCVEYNKYIEIFFASKAALVKAANNPRVYKEIRECIKYNLVSGDIIK